MFIRRGQLTLIAAGPGTGKSALVQAITQRGDDQGNTNSVFYFSADSNAWHMFTRAAAIATGRTTSSIDEELHVTGSSRLDEVLNAATANTVFDFNSSPTDDRVLGQLEAYAELHGKYPDVIVMDNLKNLDTGNGDDEFRGLEDNCVFLDEIAKASGAAVIALHHVVGALEDGFSQIPLSGVRGKVSKTPATILTLFKTFSLTKEQPLNISIVKDRGGKMDASGSYYIPIYTDLERMSFRG